MQHLRYRPDIDGLRALAVMAVVLFHFSPYWIRGGFVGVDVFFVISGYLITAIVTTDLAAGEFRFRDFYERRARRILPALLLVLAACLLAGWYLLLADEFARLGKHAAAALAFIANFSFWLEAGYFDLQSQSKPLLHLWSLGIEEQFYLLWPALVWLLSRRGRSFFVPALLIAALSFAVNLYLAMRDPSADFFSPLSRFWELAIGAALACQPPAMARALHRQSWWLSLGGLLLILAGCFAINSDSAFPGALGLMPTIGTAAVIAAGSQPWPNRVVLGNRVALLLGHISYPLYLWHWPFIAFGLLVQGILPTRITRLLLMAVAFLLAWLTTRFFEPRFRFRSDRRSLAILGTGTVILLGTAIVCWMGFVAPRNNDPTLRPILAAMKDWEFPPPDFRCKYYGGTAFGSSNSGTTSLCTKGAAFGKTLFFGDSHVQQYAVRIGRIVDGVSGANGAILLSGPGCSPVSTPNAFPWCRYMQKMFGGIASQQEVNTIVIGANWELYKAGGQAYRTELLRFLQALPHKRIFFIVDNPQDPRFDPKSFFWGSRLSYLTYHPARHTLSMPSEGRKLHEQMITLAERAHVVVIDPTNSLCHGDQCAVTQPDGSPIYRDDNHLRPGFVRDYADFIDTTLLPR